MRHDIDITEIANLFEADCKPHDISVQDVTRIALDAYTQFYKKHVLSRTLGMAITLDRDDFAEHIWHGIEEAFWTYDPLKGAKFTSYLYGRVTFRLLDGLRDMFAPSHIGIAEENCLPFNSDVISEVIQDDAMDSFGRYLWLCNEPQLFMLLPLYALGYSGRQMAHFMMVDEKTIRNWLRKLKIHIMRFQKRDNAND